MKASCLIIAAVAPLLVMVACGGDDKKPPTTASTPSASASSSSSSSSAPDTSAATATSASTPEPPAAADAGGGGGGGGAAPPSKPIIVENKDECTPVGVDFEKRARPKLKDCYAAGKKASKNPNLEGTVKIKITVDVKGKIKATKVIEKTLPDSVADCMLNVVKSTPFPEVEKCWDSTLTIPVTFPTPK